ncbi:hypothetical protein GGTG_08786 [Gaeumannomyces tritici R3-111a-1]|uniref:Uncharacterized protein n=1 Tax=Gaeumannomyces tritici (strain R3-111a-1) TaxID=644352 RepID=J3P5J7_GAET3|nr:hypothetical protein GGTG_08786 [Gaeumannomyces tritici R3-111a-1]EJT74948.1 hypothetical protein GGTG_08786 [Gaeumannomyces tritici R3-111a-1]
MSRYGRLDKGSRCSHHAAGLLFPRINCVTVQPLVQDDGNQYAYAHVLWGTCVLASVAVAPGRTGERPRAAAARRGFLNTCDMPTTRSGSGSEGPSSLRLALGGRHRDELAAASHRIVITWECCRWVETGMDAQACRHCTLFLLSYAVLAARVI